MANFLENHWGALLVGGGLAAAAVYYHEKKATATGASATAQVQIQPGATTVSVTKGGTVNMVLPTGADWSTSNAVTPLGSGATEPTGTEPFNVVMGQTAGVFPIVANWIDGNGTAQVTTINVAVS
jgi:hypothetical protein